MLRISENLKVYFSADWHFAHKSIRTLSNRHFDSMEEHDAHIIKCVNETVRKSDYLYILGDIGLHCNPKELVDKFKQINTKNIFIIKGNHDKSSTLKYLVKEKVIQTFYESKVLHINDEEFHLSHYPLRTWHGFNRNSICLYGHTHGNLADFKRSMDVGVDNVGFHPISYDFIIEKFDGIVNID